MRRIRLSLSSVFALALAAGCTLSPASDVAEGSVGRQDEAATALPFVQAPRVWNLVGSAAVAGHDRLELSLRPATGTTTMRGAIDGGAELALTGKSGVFSGSFDLRSLTPGKHELAVFVGSSKSALGRFTFYRTHPLYVFVSNDWDDPKNTDNQRSLQEKLHTAHPELRMTHFVGPYTFTDPSLTKADVDKEIAWISRMRTTYRDEIGLHIHPWCNFVEAAGVTCRKSPSFAYADGDETGYTVILASYTKAETGKLLDKALSLFAKNGLPRPTSFRAGGWTSEIHTLQALSERGFVADASGANWARLEEWKDEPGTSLYAWNQTHWRPLGDRSQPYHPNQSDMLATTRPALSLLELPNNGALCDYVTTSEMLSILGTQWSSGALAAPGYFSIGYHPGSFDDYHTRLEGALDGIDKSLAARDKGPLVYVTAADLAKVY